MQLFYLWMAGPDKINAFMFGHLTLAIIKLDAAQTCRQGDRTLH